MPGQVRETALRLPEPAAPFASPASMALGAMPARAAAGQGVAAPIAASAGPSLDAETLAALVNDVLAEQARRHGVDLS
jgi:hypothetical protein